MAGTHVPALKESARSSRGRPENKKLRLPGTCAWAGPGVRRRYQKLIYLLSTY